MSATAASHGSDTGGVSLRGNTSLVLGGTPSAYRVETGQVAVFGVPAPGGQPAGPRQYLFTCGPGDLLLGEVAGDGTCWRFLAVGLEDARLRAVPPEELAAADLREALEAWVGRVTAALGAESPPALATLSGSDEQLTLAEGQVYRAPPEGIIWVWLEQGTAALFGQDELALPSGGIPLPLGADGWVRATAAAQLRLRAATDGAALLDGLRHLHALGLAYLERRRRQEAERATRRLEERQRQEADDLSGALGGLQAVLRPREAAAVPAGSELLAALGALGREIGVEFREPGRSEDAQRVKDPLEPLARAARVRFRHVLLRDDWWRHDNGPLLAYLGPEERPVALLPTSRGYELFDPRTGTRRPVGGPLLRELSPRAVMFYRPLPARPMTLGEAIRWGLRCVAREGAFILALSVGGTVVGMLVPQATRWVFDTALPDADGSLLYELAFCLLAVNCGTAAFSLAQSLITLRAQSGLTSTLQAAVWDRLLRLPVAFFRRYASGDLLNRAMMISEMSQELGENSLRTLFSGVVALLNFGLLAYYSMQLALIAVGIVVVLSLATGAAVLAIRRRSVLLQERAGQLNGLVVQMIQGIAKLRVAGAERRAYTQWARRMAEQLRLTKQVGDFGIVPEVLGGVAATVGAILIYFCAVQMMASGAAAQSGAAAPAAGPLTMGTFLAFNAAFGLFMTGATSVSHTLVDIVGVLAKRRLVAPLLETATEELARGADPGRLGGAVRLEDVVFRYREDGPLILHGVSLEARAGEFVALVGPSGSGKSTIFKILLGFDRPASGTVCYDDQDLAGLDPGSVRRQIGTVLQGGRIGSGSVFDNIACGNLITLDDAWLAAADAGLMEDVQAMPMGMHTVISEGGGNLSGGQRQRLLIARALALHPRILLFDEATSALDNRTQEIVTKALDRRKVTRLVIAHRLSTVRTADRICVLDNGRVVQTGTYDELAARPGLFKRMVERQSV